MCFARWVEDFIVRFRNRGLQQSVDGDCKGKLYALCTQMATTMHVGADLGYIGSQPHSTAAPAAGVDASGSNLVDISQQLRLAHTRVSH